MSVIKFSKEDLEKIKEAVKKAESKTSGEIATAFIKQSYDYAIQELTFAVICGFVYFFIISFFTPAIESFLQKLFWEYSSAYLVMFYGLSTFLTITIFYFLANIPFVDRLIVSRKTMQQKVHERAIRHFMESGVYNTKDRTGILIFISFLEKRVELLADTGISAKIPQEKWNSIVNQIVEGIKQKKLVDNLIAAIDECGKLLSEHFPIQPDDKNELKDDINILKK
ncbi:MAG: TPM domain-containing protein [Candidatus Cloacimonadota bacterium]|nr:MAG: TPM domain-containing protein [Candidatus Cloacimonadota bacterium]